VAKNTVGIGVEPPNQRFADLVLEPGDVAPHDRLRPVAVAGHDRLEQLDVLLDGRAVAHLVVEDEEPEPQAEVEVALQGALEEGVARGLVDLSVDPLVHPHQLALVHRAARRQGREQLVQGAAIGGGAALRGEPRRVAFEHNANLGDAREVGDLDVGDERAAMRHALHELLVGQPLQRLADRRATDRQLLLQARLVDHRAGSEVERDDAVADPQVGLLALRAGGEPGQRDGRPRRRFLLMDPRSHPSGRPLVRRTDMRPI